MSALATSGFTEMRRAQGGVESPALAVRRDRIGLRLKEEALPALTAPQKHASPSWDR